MFRFKEMYRKVMRVLRGKHPNGKPEKVSRGAYAANGGCSRVSL